MANKLSSNQSDSSSTSNSNINRKKNFDLIMKMRMDNKKLPLSIIDDVNKNKVNKHQSLMMITERTKSKGLERILKFNQNLFGDQKLITNNKYSNTLITSNNIQSDSSRVTYLIVHHLLRLIVLILCIIGCMVQIISIINIFFSYPAIVFVDIHQMERLTLPGITICNNNRFVILFRRFISQKKFPHN